MIWHQESIIIKDRPDLFVNIFAYYNPPGRDNIDRSIIEIIGEISSNDHSEKIILYNHNPSMLKAEDPSPDDISAKYFNNLVKAKRKLVNRDWASWGL